MSVRGGNIRDAQNRLGIVDGRFAAQLETATVRAPRARRFGGPLALPASPAAKPTTLSYQRLLQQTKQVANELGLAKRPATEQL